MEIHNKDGVGPLSVCDIFISGKVYFLRLKKDFVDARIAHDLWAEDKINLVNRIKNIY